MPFSNAAEARLAITVDLEDVLHICTVASLTTYLLKEHSKYSLSVILTACAAVMNHIKLVSIRDFKNRKVLLLS